ncbi:acyltransferase [Kitasatospora atroaurantiaca]|uniref:Peptidoglycan/LPS O-acetylase OafA/YrhL n=1 Tax=Kitasatospora atroaurantiaca TaxID=285545 RepID=A0A561EYL5_9ACTN|nr:acyltransferase [Kitasatospora atroaurantiaca]TWE20692.1 peptidoglycan/LPS O-acetylase OafA/YrhL [Kitasatospora atroaurantiaca]
MSQLSWKGPEMASPAPAWEAFAPSAAAPAGPVEPVLPVEPPASVPAARPGRDRYLDMLRALALGRVITYHLFGWAWLPFLFPSMGVMFALAGSLMARSLSRPALQVIRGRLRRLLPPMWLFGVLLIAGMVSQGWSPSADGNPARWWLRMLFWIVPFSEPPYAADMPEIPGLLDTTWAMQMAVPLWYLRAYLWFVLASPLLLRAVRRFPWPTVLAPLAVSWFLSSGLVPYLEGRAGEALRDFTTFAACWLLGFAHNEGVLKRLPGYLAPSIAPFILGFGFWWATSHPTEDGYDLDSIPFAQAVWSFGFVLMLLQLSPSWTSWPPKLERWNGLISLLNARAVTVYLWHIPALIAAIALREQGWRIDWLGDNMPWLLNSRWLALGLSLPLIALVVLLFGWMEDVAAKRRPRLFPWPRVVRPTRVHRRA